MSGLARSNETLLGATVGARCSVLQRKTRQYIRQQFYGATIGSEHDGGSRGEIVWPLPIGHQTGGLAETIKDGETGFLFDKPSMESFLGSVRRAFSAFNAKDQLDTMRRSAMSKSYSWELSAARYSTLYRKIIAPPSVLLSVVSRPQAAPPAVNP
jgi:hypothetical protein